MANLSKFSAQEALNLEATMNWKTRTATISADDTLHIDVTGYHKIVFSVQSVPRPAFTFSADAGVDIDLSSDTDFMYLTGDVIYELPIPAMMNGSVRKDSDPLYFNLYGLAGASRKVTYNLS